MNRYRQLGVIASILLTALATFAQTDRPRDLRTANTQSDNISISATLPMDKALGLIDELARRASDKVVIDPSARRTPIGIDISNRPWREALDAIAAANGLKVAEGRNYLLLASPTGGDVEVKIPTGKTLWETREVLISVLFFELNSSRMQQLGMNWKLLNGSSDGITSSAAESKAGLFQIDIDNQTDLGALTATLKALANNQVGDLLASPQVTVCSGQEGRIQIGSDFSVTTKDFSGNTITQFFSTGSIIKVMPDILVWDSTTFIHLDLEVQKSNANNSDLGIEVKKTSAQTSLLLLNGEETLIGGLYYNERSTTREGIPFLKDLPWWALGLRYVCGYETESTLRKELVVILKAELLPPLKERALAKRMRAKEPRVLEQNLLGIEKRLGNYLDQVNAPK